jgi:ABC-type bacteriocin/lantibiotic exporter with double-glycine peptidase domain
MNLSAWRYYAKLYHGFYKILWLSIASSIVLSLLVLPVAYLIRLSVDKAIPAGDLRLLLLAGVVLFLLNVGTACVTLWTRHETLKLTKTAMQRLREDLLRKIYSFSRGYYSRLDRKKLHANIVQDTERLDNMGQYLVMGLLPSLIITVVLVGVLVVLNWYLFVISVSVAPLILIVNRMMAKRVKERSREYQRAIVLFSKGIQFVLQVLELTWTLSVEEFEMERQRKTFQSLHKAGRSMNWLNTAYSEVNSAMIASMTVIIMVVGGMAIISGSMTLGDLLSFYVVLNILRTHIATISSSIPIIIGGNESLVTLLETLKEEDEKPYSGTSTIEFDGGITLVGVDFQYNDRPLLRNVNLAVRPHTAVAIVGANGSGKSTIINLILGFYRPQRGQLFASDHPYDDIHIVSLRRQIGVVPQDPVLFPGTILENITYGHPDIPRADVITAADMATAHAFIGDLPQGYETSIGEHGMLLSGGQRQRIAIARALVNHPKLLILDEPTNHLDAIAIRNVMKNLKSAESGPAILLISHNRDVFRETDCIYRLYNGGTTEIGPAEVARDGEPGPAAGEKHQ